VAPRLLPDRGAAAALTGKYGLGPYLTEIRVVSGSKLVGKTLKQAAVHERYGIQVLELLRGERRDVERIESMPLKEDDDLIVQGKADDLLRLRREQGIALLPDIKLDDEELGSDGLKVMEGIVTPTSRMIGKTLGEIDFRNQFGGFVMAIRRVGATLTAKVGRVPLQAADSLLMLIPEARVNELRRTGALVVVSELDLSLRRERFWWVVFVLLPVVVALAALGVVEIAVGAPLAAIVLLLLGAVTPQQVYRTVNWSVLFLIAAFVPVGQAMVSTGTAAFLSASLLAVGSFLPASLQAQCGSDHSDSHCLGSGCRSRSRFSALPHGSVLRCFGIVHDSDGLQDQPDGLWARWVSIFRLCPRRCAAECSILVTGERADSMVLAVLAKRPSLGGTHASRRRKCEEKKGGSGSCWCRGSRHRAVGVAGPEDGVASRSAAETRRAVLLQHLGRSHAGGYPPGLSGSLAARDR